MTKSASPSLQIQLFDSLVKKRLKTTMAYFVGACCTTGFMINAFKNSRMVFMNPWIMGIATIGFGIATYAINYERNFLLKNIVYGGFIGCISLSLTPILYIYSIPIIFDALLATTALMGALGAVAWYSPNEKFLKYGGALAIGLGGMMGTSLLMMFFPGSPALRSIWLYGGLALFGGFVLYDTQKILLNAKTQVDFDPINNSIEVYMDAV